MPTIARDAFTCRCCGSCCRIPDGIVRVSSAEIVRIAAYLGMRETDFIERETVLAPDRRSLMLKNTPSGACVWLTDDNLCRINPVKPDKCRTFPFEWANADSDSVCPELRARCRQSDGLKTESPSAGSAQGDDGNPL